MAKTEPPISPALLERYEALVAEHPELERKGKKIPYTSMNGNMFSFITQEGRLALRLDKDARAAFLEAHPSSTVVQYGALMKDYIAVPDATLEDPEALRALFRECVENARTLKPKATTRKKAPAKKAVKKAAAKKKAVKKG